MKYVVKVEFEVIVEANDKHSALVEANEWLGEDCPGHATTVREAMPGFEQNAEEFKVIN
jgi:hypothetical protein